MKIKCKCGAVIYDQTDYLSYKARFVADRDWEDFVAVSASTQGIDSSYVRNCYQCLQCGRLYIDDPERHLRSFAPEDDSKSVLDSSKGESWRAPLIAVWEDKPFADQPRGSIFCEAQGGVAEHYDDWNQMESDYYVLFKKLRALDLVRSAFLRKNRTFLHSWPPRGGA